MPNIVIQHRSKHHAKNSGYGKLADYINSENLPYFDSKFPYKIAKWLASFASKSYGSYDTMSVIKDYELCKRILFSNEKGIVHYLKVYCTNNLALFRNLKLAALFFVPWFRHLPRLISSSLIAPMK